MEAYEQRPPGGKGPQAVVPGCADRHRPPGWRLDQRPLKPRGRPGTSATPAVPEQLVRPDGQAAPGRHGRLTKAESPGRPTPERHGRLTPESLGQVDPGRPGRVTPGRRGRPAPGRHGRLTPNRHGRLDPESHGRLAPDRHGQLNAGSSRTTYPDVPILLIAGPRPHQHYRQLLQTRSRASGPGGTAQYLGRPGFSNICKMQAEAYLQVAPKP